MLITQISWIIITINQVAVAAPQSPNLKGNETGVDLRVFKKIQKTTLLFETKHRNELDSINYQLYNVGAYYRVLQNLKLGFFVWHEEGNRYDGDWKKTDNFWQWQQTNSRGENSLVFDVTPGFETSIENLVFEWKNRLIFNTANGNNLLRTRPGFNYFIFKDDRPLVNLFLQAEFYLPMSYGVRTVYERWIYLGILYHLDQNFLVGPYFSKRVRRWESGEFKSDFWGIALNFVF